MKRYPYKKLSKYPHLLTEDVVLWELFLDKYPTRFAYADYDIHVGNGMKIDPSWEPNIQKMAKTLSQFRIDVVGWSGDTPTIIEVKPRASSKAIGQVVIYRSLFPKTYPGHPEPKSLIVTNWDHEEIFKIAFENNISIVTV